MSSPTDEAQPTVFLEDIDPNYKTKRPEDEEQSASQSSQKTANSSQEKPKVSNKRQRTIEDMFFGGKKSKEPAKKIKLATSEIDSASASKKITVTPLKTSGMQKLNSIPFSLSDFMDSLDEEKRQLLRLECEVMGKSWLETPFLDF